MTGDLLEMFPSEPVEAVRVIVTSPKQATDFDGVVERLVEEADNGEAGGEFRRPWKYLRDGSIVDRVTGAKVGVIVWQEPIRFEGVTGTRGHWRASNDFGIYTCRLRDDAALCAWETYLRHNPFRVASEVGQ